MSSHVFVVPRGDEMTGGNLYNAALVANLRRFEDVACVEVDVAEASQRLSAGEPGLYWVDTLFLDAFPELWRARRHPRSVLGLLLHYLPSLVRYADRWTPELLAAAEAEALRGADAFLVSGAFMASVVRRAGLGERPLVQVEPAAEGLSVAREPYRPGPRPVTALLVANLVEGKGILPFLRSLAGRVQGDEGLRIDIIGRLDMDPSYADACRSAVLHDHGLHGAVRLLGPRPPEDCRRHMLASDVFVSCSRMESYGMALAEARVCGMVVVARAGGNIAQHVDAASGGRLCADESEVASECVALARDRETLARRSALAAARAPRGRSWSEAAAEYVRLTLALGLA